MCYFYINSPQYFDTVSWVLSQVIIKSCLTERTCAMLPHCPHLLFWNTVSPHVTYNFSHKCGSKDAFLGLMKIPPSWPFHNMREPCLTKPLGTVAHKELLWAALTLITWVSGPQDLDPEPFFSVSPSLTIFMRNLNGTWKKLRHTEHTQSGGNAWWQPLKLFKKHISVQFTAPFLHMYLNFHVLCNINQYKLNSHLFFTVSLYLKVNYCKLRLVRLILSWWCCNGEEWLNQTIKLFIAKH